MFFRKKQKKRWGLFFKIKLIIGFLCFLSLLPLVNWIYHVVRNPSQVLSTFNTALIKTPHETWKSYKESFIENSTSTMTPEFLAALAQQESAGNPMAQPYWRWDLKSNPFEIYAPASSSSGLFQMTQGTFDEEKKFCIHSGKVAAVGRWYNINSCWFNAFYSRLSPTDSIEMTSAYLQFWTEKILGGDGASLRRKQDIAAVIHLCGARKAQQFARSGARAFSTCGDHSVSSYLARVRGLEKKFALFREQGVSQKLTLKANR